MSPTSETRGAPKILPSNVTVWSVVGMKSSLRVWTYGVMSSSHFCDANSAVQTTSSSKASQSPDFAFWRCTNWSCCCCASSGNSVSLTWRSGLAALNSLMVSLRSPEVSLPEQYVTLPLAFFIDAGSTALMPDVAPFSLVLDPPPPESLPQATIRTVQARAAQSRKTNRLDTSSPSGLPRCCAPWTRLPWSVAAMADRDLERTHGPPGGALSAVTLAHRYRRAIH